MLFLGAFCWLAWNHFEIPEIHWFTKTSKVKGVVTEVRTTYEMRGWPYQRTEYQYTVEDSTYIDKFLAGTREGYQNVGDSLLIEYDVNAPENDEVIGFYRNGRKASLGSGKIERKH